MPRRQVPTVLGQTINFPKYGEDGDGLIFRSPLTDLTSVEDLNTALGYTNIKYYDASGQGSVKRNVIDPVLGMRSTDSAGDVVAPTVYTPSGFTVTDGDAGLLISVEVEKDWVCFEEPNSHSTGYTPPTSNGLFSFGNNSTNDTILSKGTTHLFTGEGGGVLTTEYYDWIIGSVVSGCKIHSQGKGDFVTLQFGLFNDGGTFRHFLAVDGFVLRVGANTATKTNLLNFLSIFSGTQYLAASWYKPFTAAYHIRNIQCTQLTTPLIPTNLYLRNVVGFGDSITNSLGDSYDGVYRDAAWNTIANRVCIENGFRFGTYRSSAQGGHGIKVASDLRDQLTTATGDLFDAAENDPDTVILFCGTNDAVDFTTKADYETQFLDLLDKIFGVHSGGTRTSVQHIICIVPPPDKDSLTAPQQINMGEIRDVVKSIQSAWDAHQTTMINKVVTGADYNALLGGNEGFPSYNTDGTHPDQRGNAVLGPALGAFLSNYFGGLRRNIVTR